MIINHETFDKWWEEYGGIRPICGVCHGKGKIQVEFSAYEFMTCNSDTVTCPKCDGDCYIEN